MHVAAPRPDAAHAAVSWSTVSGHVFAIAVCALVIAFVIRAAVLASAGTIVVSALLTPPRQSLVGSPTSVPLAIWSRQLRVACSPVASSCRAALPSVFWHARASAGGAAGAAGTSTAQYALGSQASGRPSPSLSS